jgi:hypothetical protein
MSTVKMDRKELAWAIASVGVLLTFVRSVPSAPPAILWADIGFLAIAVMVWLSGGVTSTNPRPGVAGVPPKQRGGAGYLAGSQVATMGNTFTILDDSAPALATAAANGGRAVVTAVDDTGQVGALFLGFDTNGAIIEASVGDNEWNPAQLV